MPDVQETKPLPIRVSDKFKDRAGLVWEVFQDHAFGRVTLLNQEKARFVYTNKSQLRAAWLRVEAK